MIDMPARYAIVDAHDPGFEPRRMQVRQAHPSIPGAVLLVPVGCVCDYTAESELWSIDALTRVRS